MKGSILDLPYIIAVLFFLAVSIFVSYELLYAIDQEGVFDEYNQSAEILDEGLAAMSLFDTGFVMLAMGLGIAVIITAFMINTHPAFFVLSWMMLVIVIFISAMLVNAFDQVASASQLATSTAQFPLLIELFMNMPLFCLVIGTMVALAMYGKGTGI